MIMNVLFYLRRWIGWIVILLAAAGILWWGYAQTTQTKVIRIATAAQGGYYYQFGSILKRHIEKMTPYTVELLVTSGSVDNRGRLLANKADFAIVQTAAVSMQNLAAVSPLWDDYVQLIVRKDSRIESLNDLEGKNVTIGKKGSGYRANAMSVLDYYGVDANELGMNEAYFMDLLKDPALEGAIVTTGLVNPDLRTLLASGQFELLSLPGSAGFVFNHTYYRQGDVPEGVYPGQQAPLPRATVATVTTDAIMAARPQVPAAMVEAMLNVLNSLELRSEAPSLVQRPLASDPIWSLLPVHEVAKNHFNPYAGFGLAADFLAQLARFKELLILLVVGLVFGRYQWRAHRRSHEEQKTREVTRLLERMFQDVVEIEQVQKEAKDIRLLQEHLGQINYIKMKALKVTLGTPMQDSGLFVAFLQQATTVIREIEWRLSMAAAHAPSLRTQRSEAR